MKKTIALLSLIAIFVVATTMSAQTPAPKTVKTKAKTEAKACCKDPKSAECCKNKKADAKTCTKSEKAACDKKAATAKK